MDVCGAAGAPARKHLLTLASKTGISERSAAETIERIVMVAEHCTDFACDLPIRKETLELIEKAVRSNSARVV
jgi:serine/threonine-protein kinase HipA